MTIRQVTVVGGGTMGRGIAYICAVSGFETAVLEVEESAVNSTRAAIEALLHQGVERGKLTPEGAVEASRRMQFTSDAEVACRDADLIIEAVPEDLGLKKDILSQADLYCGEETMLASNTSSISISELAKSVERRERFLGMHFFNPPHAMKLVEIVAGERTSQATIDEATAFARALGKEPIVVRDSPGFATSRLGLALSLEAIRMLESEVGSAEDIDQAMVLGYNHPMGPLRLADMIGLDVNLDVAEYLHSTLGARYEPPALLRRMVAERRLGRKTGSGFYEWS